MRRIFLLGVCLLTVLTAGAWSMDEEPGLHVDTMGVEGPDTSFRDGAVYALKVGYGTPHGLEPIDSLVFTMRQGAYTYWTADGQVLPLPEEGQGVCKVPAEAVAVDLRGRQVQGITAAVDVVEANPNCLYYMDSDDVLPEGMTADLNVIRGLQAECVQVSDEYDYYCPLAFKADYISYLLKPSYDDPWAEEHHLGYSQTLVLPFYVSDVLLYDVNGKNASLHEDELVVFQYFGCDADTLQISRLGSVKWMQAYTPYILGVYVGSRLLFIGEDTQVPMTREAITRGQDYDFVGTTVRRHIDHAYLYSARDDCFVLDWAGLGVEPFRAAICMGQGDPSAGVPDHLSFDSCIWGDRGRPGAVSEPADHDGIGEQSCDCVARRLPVCTLSGQHVATADCADGSLHGLGLRPGVYVTGNRKILVK